MSNINVGQIFFEIGANTKKLNQASKEVKTFSQAARKNLQNTNKAFNNNEWHHAVFTYDGSGNRTGMKIYIDAVEQACSTQGQATLSGSIQTDAPLTIGCRSKVATRATWWKGDIDNIRLYNKELTQEEVRALCNNKTGTEDLSGCFSWSKRAANTTRLSRSSQGLISPTRSATSVLSKASPLML